MDSRVPCPRYKRVRGGACTSPAPPESGFDPKSNEGKCHDFENKKGNDFFCTKHNIQYVLHKINLYPMFAVYMYKNIDMLKSKQYTR